MSGLAPQLEGYPIRRGGGAGDTVDWDIYVMGSGGTPPSPPAWGMPPPLWVWGLESPAPPVGVGSGI